MKTDQDMKQIERKIKKLMCNTPPDVVKSLQRRLDEKRKKMQPGSSGEIFTIYVR